MTKRATDVEKKIYKLSIGERACWCGTCPRCGQIFSAAEVTTSQRMLIDEIRAHMEDEHS